MDPGRGKADKTIGENLTFVFEKFNRNLQKIEYFSDDYFFSIAGVKFIFLKNVCKGKNQNINYPILVGSGGSGS